MTATRVCGIDPCNRADREVSHRQSTLLHGGLRVAVSCGETWAQLRVFAFVSDHHFRWNKWLDSHAPAHAVECFPIPTYCTEYCCCCDADPEAYASAFAFDDLRSLEYQSGEPYMSPCVLMVPKPSELVTVMLSEGGESERLRELKMPRISRRSSETWSLGAWVRSLMKSLIERMIGGQLSSLGSHQSDGGAPMPSSMRLRSTSE